MVRNLTRRRELTQETRSGLCKLHHPESAVFNRETWEFGRSSRRDQWLWASALKDVQDPHLVTIDHSRAGGCIHSRTLG